MTPEEEFEVLSLASVRRDISRRREENVNLEFKTAASPMVQDDRRNLAKAVSAFANSDGGLIVWGVQTERRGAESCATTLRPISPLSTFLSELNQYTADAAKPIVEGVRHKRLLERRGRDSGIAVTLVPASDAGPHMAKFRENRYMKRSGSQTVQMEHFDIEDMFGRRRKPVIKLLYSAGSGSSGSAGGYPFWEVRILIALQNVGRGSAAAPYLRLDVAPPYALSPYGISIGSHPAVPHEALMPPLPDRKSFVAKSTFVLHPGPRYEVALVHAEVRDHVGLPEVPGHVYSLPDLTINHAIGAENLRLAEDQFTIPSQLMNDVARARRVVDWPSTT